MPIHSWTDRVAPARGRRPARQRSSRASRQEATGTRSAAERDRVVLIADDEEAAHELMRVQFAKLWRIRSAYNVPQALDALANLVERGEPLVGAMVDLKMPGGTGLDVLTAARKAFPDAFLALTTGFVPSDDEMRELHVLGAHCYEKDRLTLRDLSLRVLETDPALGPRVTRMIGELTREQRLSHGEVQVLMLACGGFLMRSELAERLGVELTTVKSKISSLLYKTARIRETRTLRELVWWIYHSSSWRSPEP
jgi:DNA-binding NarL/FixJ family response regulator